LSLSINKLVNEGMIIFDIGANIGFYALQFAAKVGHEGKVFAFEPVNWAFNKLSQNVEINTFNNVILEKLALSDENLKDETIEFYASWPCEQGSQRDPIHGTGRKIKDVVDFLTLDNYVSMQKIQRIDLIKIDVDGYEYKVVKGGIQSLKKFRPILIVEFFNLALNEVGDNVKKLVDLISSLNYSFYSLKFMAFDSNDNLLLHLPSDSYRDIVCVPMETNLEVIY